MSGPRTSLILGLALLLGACSSNGKPAPTGPSPASGASVFEDRPVVAASGGAAGDLAGVPFTRGVIAEDDPYRHNPQFAEGPPPSAGELVTFADENGDGFYSPGETKFELGPASVTAADVSSARAVPSPNGGWAVNVKLDEAGTKALDTLSRNAIGDQLAIVVDRLVASAPIVQGPITGGDVQITAPGMTESRATALAAELQPPG